MKFKYLKLPLSEPSDFFGHYILKPIIPIEIRVNDQSIRYAILIDSGADFCIFDAEIGECLGLDVKAGEEIGFGGIQELGGAKAYLHPVTIIVGGWSYQTTVAFSYHIGKRGFGIPGQKGFFDLFSVKFDLRKEEIELKARLKSP